MKQIDSGAEAVIFLDDKKVIKKRIKKNYRIKEIDLTLRHNRTKTEAKILQKIPINAPKLLNVTNDETLEMEFIEGNKVRDILKKKLSIAIKIGKQVALMHNAGIIHNDLTTSNMILKNKEVYFIDFGLSFFSHKIEDKAVDLHLFKQALESKHHEVSKEAFSNFLKGYEIAKNNNQVIQRLKNVESRGRYKKK